MHYNVCLEHVEEFLEEGFRRHYRSFVELLLSDVVIFMHWLRKNKHCASMPLYCFRQNLSLMFAHLNKRAQHVDRSVRHTIVTTLQRFHNFYTNFFANPV